MDVAQMEVGSNTLQEKLMVEWACHWLLIMEHQNFSEFIRAR
jgi:hypothetical protein